jgi:dephospho-CoA kinase
MLLINAFQASIMPPPLVVVIDFYPMVTAQSENLPRMLLGISAQLFLYQTRPESYAQQIKKSQQALQGIVHSFFQLGRQVEILQSIGPLLLTSLSPYVPEETELGSYLKVLSQLESESEIPSIHELVSGFDNVIVLLGKKASGKGTINQILAEEYGISGMPTSDWLRAIAASRNYTEPFNPIMLRELGDELRKEFGGEVLVWLTLQEYALKGRKNVVFDGLRSEVEMKELVGKLNVSLIWIDAPDEKRLERVKKRNRAGDPKTIEKLLEVDKKSFPEADALRQMAKFVIENPEDDIKALEQKIESLMGTLNINKAKAIIR